MQLLGCLILQLKASRIDRCRGSTWWSVVTVGHARIGPHLVHRRIATVSLVYPRDGPDEKAPAFCADWIEFLEMLRVNGDIAGAAGNLRRKSQRGRRCQS